MSYRYKMVVCRNDDDYESFARFFMENRTAFYRPYDVKGAVSIIEQSIKYGNIILFYNKLNEPVGLIIYYIGTPQNNYEDKHVAYISFILIRKDYHGTRVFLDGMKAIVEALKPAGVEDIRFGADSDNRYLRILYGKLAKVVDRIHYDKQNKKFLVVYPEEDVYSMKYADFAQIVKRFEKKGSTKVST